jgi:archaellin
MFRNFKVLSFVLVVMVIAGSAYAFAASNTVAESAAGYKASVVPGYAVTNIVYDLDATDPTVVDAITFDISPSTGSSAAALAKLQTETAGAWTDCTLVAGVAPLMEATCTFGSLALEDVTALNIVASSSTDPAP